MRNNRLIKVSQAAIIAALYVVLTFISSLMGLASGAIQVRLSEALCVLPCFTGAAVPGLFIGCIVANLLTGCAMWDVVFGSLATLIGAVLCRILRKHRVFALIPNIVSNTVIVPLVLMFVYAIPGSFWYFALTVGIGEIISCGILGVLLGRVLDPHKDRIFGHGNRLL